MWFKNLLVYRFTQPFVVPDDLDYQLSNSLFVPCGSQDLARVGWIPPMRGLQVSHQINGCVLLCLRKQQKILPAAAITEALETKIAELEERESRKIYRKEKRQLKEEIVIAFLPKALTRSKRLFAYIDVKNQWLLIDTNSHTAAEEFLTQLRNDIGSLPVQPLQVNDSIVVKMTDWVRTEPMAGNLALGSQCDLRDNEESANTAKFRAQELNSDEVISHLEHGKQVVRLELNWHGAIDFVLDDELTLRRLKFDDALRERLENVEEQIAYFDGEFSIMTLELGKLVTELTGALGGITE